MANSSSPSRNLLYIPIPSSYELLTVNFPVLDCIPALNNSDEHFLSLNRLDCAFISMNPYLENFSMLYNLLRPSVPPKIAQFWWQNCTYQIANNKSKYTTIVFKICTFREKNSNQRPPTSVCILLMRQLNSLQLNFSNSFAEKIV